MKKKSSKADIRHVPRTSANSLGIEPSASPNAARPDLDALPSHYDHPSHYYPSMSQSPANSPTPQQKLRPIRDPKEMGERGLLTESHETHQLSSSAPPSRPATPFPQLQSSPPPIPARSPLRPAPPPWPEQSHQNQLARPVPPGQQRLADDQSQIRTPTYRQRLPALLRAEQRHVQQQALDRDNAVARNNIHIGQRFNRDGRPKSPSELSSDSTSSLSEVQNTAEAELSHSGNLERQKLSDRQETIEHQASIERFEDWKRDNDIPVGTTSVNDRASIHSKASESSTSTRANIVFTCYQITGSLTDALNDEALKNPKKKNAVLKKVKALKDKQDAERQTPYVLRLPQYSTGPAQYQAETAQSSAQAVAHQRPSFRAALEDVEDTSPGVNSSGPSARGADTLTPSRSYDALRRRSPLAPATPAVVHKVDVGTPTPSSTRAPYQGHRRRPALVQEPPPSLLVPSASLEDESNNHSSPSGYVQVEKNDLTESHQEQPQNKPSSKLCPRGRDHEEERKKDNRPLIERSPYVNETCTWSCVYPTDKHASSYENDYEEMLNPPHGDLNPAQLPDPTSPETMSTISRYRTASNSNYSPSHTLQTAPTTANPSYSLTQNPYPMQSAQASPASVFSQSPPTLPQDPIPNQLAQTSPAGVSSQDPTRLPRVPLPNQLAQANPAGVVSQSPRKLPQTPPPSLPQAPSPQTPLPSLPQAQFPIHLDRASPAGLYAPGLVPPPQPTEGDGRLTRRGNHLESESPHQESNTIQQHGRFSRYMTKMKGKLTSRKSIANISDGQDASNQSGYDGGRKIKPKSSFHFKRFVN